MAKNSHVKVEMASGSKELREINLTDWNTAINEAVELKFDDITKLIEAFTQYYLNPSTAKAYACAIDMAMRFSSKPEQEVNTYKQWIPKMNRAIEVYQITQNEFNILLSSLEPTGDEGELDENGSAMLQEIKNSVGGLLTAATSLTNVISSDYYIKEEK